MWVKRKILESYINPAGKRMVRVLFIDDDGRESSAFFKFDSNIMDVDLDNRLNTITTTWAQRLINDDTEKRNPRTIDSDIRVR